MLHGVGTEASAEESSVFQQVVLHGEAPERDEYEDEDTYMYQRLSNAASLALSDNGAVGDVIGDGSSDDPLVQEVLQDLRRCESSSVWECGGNTYRPGTVALKLGCALKCLFEHAFEVILLHCSIPLE